MKTSITFSVEMETVSKFISECKKLSKDKNKTIQRLMGNWLDINKAKLLTCSICNANYSDRIQECPQCKINNDVQMELDNLENQLIVTGKMYNKLKKYEEDGTPVSATELSTAKEKMDSIKEKIKNFIKENKLFIKKEAVKNGDEKV